MKVKELFHIETIYRFGHCAQLAKNNSPDFGEYAKLCSKRVFFLDAPSYGNLGDQAIALAMRKFIKKFFQIMHNLKYKKISFLFIINGSREI